MDEAKYNRLPHAGDFEKKQGAEVLYLAPRPLPTGVNAFSGQRMHKEINGVFLDFAPSAGGLEFAVRVGGLRFQVQQSVDSVEPIGCQQLQMIRQHFNREFPAQCLTRSGVEQVGNLVQPLLANQRQIGALG